jgi:gluconolactonase
VVVASDGSIVFTDPPYGRWPGFGVEREQELDFQGVYRVTPDGELQLLVEDFQKPNGLCFSQDEKTLWINDTDGGHVRRFSVSSDGSLTGGEVIYQMEGFSLETGIPDGQKLDAAGNIWLSGPGGLHVITSEGALLGRILTPENVGNQAWGGEDWKTLYICTSSTVHTLRTTVAGHRTPSMN